MASPKRIPVMEVFGPTVQGEGMVIGRKTMFVRTAGCDYSCSWCDSAFTWDGSGKDDIRLLTAEQIVAELERIGGAAFDHVTISGGNPALLPQLGELIDALHERGIAAALETQGSRWQPWFAAIDDLTLSPKPPSSGMATDWAVLDSIVSRLADEHLRSVPPSGLTGAATGGLDAGAATGVGGSLDAGAATGVGGSLDAGAATGVGGSLDAGAATGAGVSLDAGAATAAGVSLAVGAVTNTPTAAETGAADTGAATGAGGSLDAGATTGAEAYNFRLNRRSFCLKVVVFDEADLAYARSVHKRYPNVPFYVQAGNGNLTETDPGRLLPYLAERYEWLIGQVMQDEHLKRVYVLPQLHAWVWGNKKGV